MARTWASFGYISPQTVKVTLKGDAVDRYITHSVSGDQITIQFDALSDGQPHTYTVQVTESGKQTLSYDFPLTCQPTGGPSGTPVSTVSISGSGTVNAGQTVSYAATADGSEPKTYQWSVTGGTIIGSATGSAVSVRWDAAGAGTVAVAVTGYAGSAQSASQPVTVQSGGSDCQCTLSVVSVTKKAGTEATYQAQLDSPNANINPFTWVVKNAAGSQIAQGQTVASNSPLAEFSLPAGSESGSYSVSFSSVPCNCSSPAFVFSHTGSNLPLCKEGPNLLRVTVLALDRVQFQFHGADIVSLDWFVEKAGQTLYNGNTGTLTSAVYNITLPAALTEGSYNLRISAATCQNQASQTLSLPFAITVGGGGGSCQCTLTLDTVQQNGQTTAVQVGATSPNTNLGSFSYEVINGAGQSVATGTFTPTES